MTLAAPISPANRRDQSSARSSTAAPRPKTPWSGCAALECLEQHSPNGGRAAGGVHRPPRAEGFLRGARRSSSSRTRTAQPTPRPFPRRVPDHRRRPSADLQEAALDALEDAGAVDIDERASAWRAEGWSGYQGSAASGYGGGAEVSTGASGFAEDRATLARAKARAGEDETVPVVEEELRVGKRDTSHGRVRVRSYVRETPVSEEVELTDERVEVERRPVDRPVSRRRRLPRAEHRGEGTPGGGGGLEGGAGGRGDRSSP